MGWGILSGANPVTAAASALPGVGEFLGIQSANQTNQSIANVRNAMEVKEAQKSRDHSSAEALLNRNWQQSEAQYNRDFQERMSNTAVSRRMKDLKASGINPILAAKNDASSPSGGMGGGSQGNSAKANMHAATVQPAFIDSMGLVNSLMDVKVKQAQKGRIEAETQGIKSGLPKKGFFEKLWEGPANDLDRMKKWSDKFQTNAQQGKYFQKPLDQADKAVEEIAKTIVGKVSGAGKTRPKGRKLTNKPGHLKAHRIKGWDSNGVPQY